MPKKIRKEKELTFKRTEQLINADNINQILMYVLAVCALILLMVASIKFSIDKYHAHAGNPIVNFEFTKKGEVGYESFILNYFEGDKTAYGTINTMEESTDKAWTNHKYLNFNEEIYRSGVLEVETQAKVEGSDPEWFMTVTTESGDVYYYSADAINQIDEPTIEKIVHKYFKK